MDEGPLGEHEVEFIVQSLPGFDDGLCDCMKWAQSSIILCEDIGCCTGYGKLAEWAALHYSISRATSYVPTQYRGGQKDGPGHGITQHVAHLFDHP